MPSGAGSPTPTGRGTSIRRTGSDPWLGISTCTGTSLIKTARRKTILLEHAVTAPTPYDRLNLVRGTKGVFMEYILAWRLAQCLKERLVPDIDVYDAAAWSAPWPLSETSLQPGRKPVKFPDFTRGGWRALRSRG